jgi:hypothetical protein
VLALSKSETKEQGNYIGECFDGKKMCVFVAAENQRHSVAKQQKII